MKEQINVFDYSEQIMKALRRGILLNTNGDKFNSMVISWGHFGVIWGEPTFVVYVREHRYTKSQLDKTMEFTLSIPLDKPDPLIHKVCGSLSGRDGRDFYSFETLTLAPYDRASIIPERLTDGQLETLNAYHARVYAMLAPHLTDAESLWLAEETAPFNR